MYLNRLLLLGIVLSCLLFTEINAESNRRGAVILVSFDGFRWDYTDRDSLENFELFGKEGVRAHSLKPAFPTSTFPNHLSIVTGMHPENHGILANRFRDPYTDNYFSIRDENAVTDSKWYQGEAFWETAKRYGIRTASYFWPGSELATESRRPDISKEYDKEVPYLERIEEVVEWLKLAEEERPQFITLYFSETDSKGHQFGTKSEEIDKGIRLCDKLLGILTDSLRNLGLFDQTDVIIVSDHGMTDVFTDSAIVIEDIINQDCDIQNYGPYMAISATDSMLGPIYDTLKQNQKHYNVYMRDGIPEYLHYSNHPFIAPILVLAEPGYVFADSSSVYDLDELKGTHGYDNTCTDMHGIFFARGPSFRKGLECGTLNNIDIYPLLCKLFGIKGRHNIDGKIERIEYILKRNR